MNLKNRLIITHHHYLQHDFQPYREQLDPIWHTAPTLSLFDWLTLLWKKHAPNPTVVLEKMETLLLWRTVIADAQPTLSHQQHVVLAASASTVWEKSVLSQRPLTDLEWGPLFQKKLTEKNYITQIELVTAILSVLKHAPLPQHMIMIGFENKPPAIDYLFSTLQQQTQVTYPPSTNQNQTTHRIAFTTETEEITIMARWASAQLTLKHKKIACIIPDKVMLSHRIDRIFSLYLPRPAYHISITKPLQGEALIQIALDVLTARDSTPDHLSFEKLRTLLLSPYINTRDADRCVAAMAQRALSQQSITPSINYTDVYHLLKKISELDYLESSLTDRWSAFFHYPINEKPQRFDTWTPIFRDILKAIGWPGQRMLNKDEQQIMIEWENILTYFSRLDHLLPAPDYGSACHILNDICRHMTSTANQNTIHDAPIHIMGLLDAREMLFDHAWVMDISDANTSPILQRLITHNQHVIFSHTARPHALLKNMAIITADQLGLSTSQVSTIHPAAFPLFAPPNDDHAPIVTDDEKIHRGSKILALQSACPFRAFATLRLGAESTYPPSVGINVLEQGILCHSALCIIWQKLKSQDALHDLSPEEQDTLVTESITDAFKAIKKSSNITQTYFLDLEKKRLHTLLHSWLEIEKNRPPFYIVALEEKYTITLGPLTFKIQIDRIDRINSNQHIVIDYKTGIIPALSNWFEDRIIDPQLPLYALLPDPKIHGIAYGSVHLNDLYFSGLINHGSAFSKVYRTEDYFKNTYDWDMLKTTWESQLTSLSYDFFNGHAAVNPRDLQTCKTCHLHAVCRIHEKNR